MIRVEYKTSDYGHGTFNEGTLEEAEAYFNALIENGVEMEVGYFYDMETRLADIKAGKIGHEETVNVFHYVKRKA